MNHVPDTTDVVVVGAGQAGLATGYHLGRRGVRHQILESRPTLGGQWRERWDSLRLFTPARYSHLPGMPLPLAGGDLPTKDQVADYLESYARRFELPVRTGVSVTGLAVAGDGFDLATSAGPLRASRVVVATGPNAMPRIPAAAASLDPAVVQLHSSEYHNPDQLPDGDVVVVGAGTSGAEIALELARSGRRTYLAGRPTPHIPDPVVRFTGPLYWAFVNHVLTRSTPIGRKAAAGFTSRGAPLIRVSMEQVRAAGVMPLPRLTGTRDGNPVFGDETVGRPAAVVWATGFGPDLRWLPDIPLTPDGWPITRRGLVDAIPGLAFVGLPFQYSLTSGLIGGVGRDAGFVAEALSGPQPHARPLPHLADRRRTP